MAYDPARALRNRGSSLPDVNDGDAERLASRLAMVASGDGEAENAGRALGQMARRLGLSGGELKSMFLAGAAAQRQARAGAAEAERLEREIQSLRKSLSLSEANCRDAARERDALLIELDALRTTLFRSHNAARLRLLIAGVAVIAALSAGAIFYLVPGDSRAPAMPPEMAAHRLAIVRSAHATVFQRPDHASPVIATLNAGAPVVVRRLLWNMLMQWVEVEIDGNAGYVLTSDIDLS